MKYMVRRGGGRQDILRTSEDIYSPLPQLYTWKFFKTLIGHNLLVAIDTDTFPQRRTFNLININTITFLVDLILQFQ